MVIQNLLGRLATRFFPYWCPYCPRRYMSMESFHTHYWACPGKLDHDTKEAESLRVIAPSNRGQRRAMAKKAGQIKDWKQLNAE